MGVYFHEKLQILLASKNTLKALRQPVELKVEHKPIILDDLKMPSDLKVDQSLIHLGVQCREQEKGQSGQSQHLHGSSRDTIPAGLVVEITHGVCIPES